MAQYTIRNIPDSVDQALRERARKRGVSLNSAALEAMSRGLGFSESEQVYDDMDDLIGTWKPDQAFENAMAEQDTVDLSEWE